jgi:hypothetical protein
MRLPPPGFKQPIPDPSEKALLWREIKEFFPGNPTREQFADLMRKLAESLEDRPPARGYEKW